MLFTHPGEQPVHFEFLGQRYSLLLCIGITRDGSWRLARSRSTKKLLALLKQHGGLFPYTTPDRPSVAALPRGGLPAGRMFGRDDDHVF